MLDDAISHDSGLTLGSGQTPFGSTSSENAPPFFPPERRDGCFGGLTGGAASNPSTDTQIQMQMQAASRRSGGMRFPPMAPQTPTQTQTCKPEPRLSSGSASRTFCGSSTTDRPCTPPRPLHSSAIISKRLESSPGIDAALRAFEDGQREWRASEKATDVPASSPPTKSRLARIFGMGSSGGSSGSISGPSSQRSSARILLAESPQQTPNVKLKPDGSGSITATSSPLAMRSCVPVAPAARLSQPTSNHFSLEAPAPKAAREPEPETELTSALVAIAPKTATLEEVIARLVSGASGKFLVQVFLFNSAKYFGTNSYCADLCITKFISMFCSLPVLVPCSAPSEN